MPSELSGGFYSRNYSIVHESIIWHILYKYVLLGNECPNMNKRGEHWCMTKHGDMGEHARNENRASSGYIRTLNPP